jgi:hypothetical protein
MIPCAEKESLINIVEITNPELRMILWKNQKEKKENSSKITSMIIKRIKKSSKNILLMFLKVAISFHSLADLLLSNLQTINSRTSTTGIKMVAIVFNCMNPKKLCFFGNCVVNFFWLAALIFIKLLNQKNKIIAVMEVVGKLQVVRLKPVAWKFHITNILKYSRITMQL